MATEGFSRALSGRARLAMHDGHVRERCLHLGTMLAHWVTDKCLPAACVRRTSHALCGTVKIRCLPRTGMIFIVPSIVSARLCLYAADVGHAVCCVLFLGLLGAYSLRPAVTWLHPPGGRQCG